MKKVLLYGTGIGVIGYALYKYFMRQKDLLLDYSWEIAGIKVTKVTPTEVIIVFSMKFISKADIEAKVNSVYLDVYLDNKSVGYVTEQKPFILPAKGHSFIDLNITFNPKLIFQNVIDFTLGLIQKKDMSIDLKGYADIQSSFIKTTLPLEYHTTFKEYFANPTTTQKK
jgi:LEA14-like dessication related protein